MCIVVDATTQQYFSLTSLLQVYFVNRNVSVTMSNTLMKYLQEPEHCVFYTSLIRLSSNN